MCRETSGHHFSPCQGCLAWQRCIRLEFCAKMVAFTPRDEHSGGKRATTMLSIAINNARQQIDFKRKGVVPSLSLSFLLYGRRSHTTFSLFCSCETWRVTAWELEICVHMWSSKELTYFVYHDKNGSQIHVFSLLKVGSKKHKREPLKRHSRSTLSISIPGICGRGSLACLCKDALLFYFLCWMEDTPCMQRRHAR